MMTLSFTEPQMARIPTIVAEIMATKSRKEVAEGWKGNGLPLGLGLPVIHLVSQSQPESRTMSGPLPSCSRTLRYWEVLDQDKLLH